MQRPEELPRRVLPRRGRAAPHAALRAAQLPAVRVEVHGDDGAAAFDTPAAALPRAASWPEVALQQPPMPEAPQAEAEADAAMQDAPPLAVAAGEGAAAAQEPQPAAEALPPPPPMQEEAGPAAAQRKKAAQSRAITDFFSPVRPPLLPQGDCINAAAGPNGTPEPRAA
jgi:hypothetical protein